MVFDGVFFAVVFQATLSTLVFLKGFGVFIGVSKMKP